MLFCFRSIQNDFKILSAPRNRNHSAPTWGQMKHCISGRKEIKYHLKCELLVSDASLCTQQQWNSFEGFVNHHSPSRSHKDCNNMDETGRKHNKVAVGLVPPWHLPLPPALLSQGTQSWAEECRGSCPWFCPSGIALVLPELYPHTDSQQPQAAKLVLDWICICFLLSFAGRRLYRVPEVSGKGKAMQMLNSKILDARSSTVLC